MTQPSRAAPTRRLALGALLPALILASLPARASADPADEVPAAARAQPAEAARSEPTAQAAAALAAAQASPAAPATAAAAPAPAPEPEPAKRVVFIPESVKAQLREEIKREVLEQAAREGWAASTPVSNWLQRIKPGGDFRARFERDILRPGNANNGEFPDFNAINTGGPFDANGVDLSNDRFLNVDQSRTRPRIRALLGADVDLGPGLSLGLRLGSGDSSSPITNNQTLGASGGYFSKYQLWIDRASLRFEPIKGALVLEVGRFANPFFGTQLLWWDDLSFDGAVFQGKLPLRGGLKPFLSAGAFPLYTSGQNFPSERTDKFPSTNKWLYAVQAGSEWSPHPGLLAELAFAFYDFNKLEGVASGPCDTNLKSVSCDSDESRPSYAQRGNSYFALRSPSAAALAAEASSLVARYQYYGLVSRFRELAATGRLEWTPPGWLKFAVDLEYVHNAGFRRSEIEQKVPLNNRGPLQGTDPLGPFVGGNNGVLGRLSLGTPALEKLGDWRARLVYRYLESDAVVDAINDPDFGLGGTNLKGYSADVSLSLGSGLTATARWFSADEIAGPKLAIDVLELDLQARF